MLSPEQLQTLASPLGSSFLILALITIPPCPLTVFHRAVLFLASSTNKPASTALANLSSLKNIQYVVKPKTRHLTYQVPVLELYVAQGHLRPFIANLTTSLPTHRELYLPALFAFYQVHCPMRSCDVTGKKKLNLCLYFKNTTVIYKIWIERCYFSIGKLKRKVKVS